MNIAILGAGAMGSLYASYLVPFHSVTLIDSFTPLIEHINTKGLVKVNHDHTETSIKAKAVLSGTRLVYQDLVIVFVKGIHTYEAMKNNQSLFGPDTIVMTLQNGAGNNRDIAQFVPRERIIVGTSSHNSVSLELGKFYHSGCGPTNIGPDLPCEESLQGVNKVAQALKESGLTVNIIENIQYVLWQKLVINCGINALSTLMQCRIGEIYTNPWLWDLCRKIVYECVLIAEADGTYLDRKEALIAVQKVCENDADGYASMYQDRQKQRLTEIDRINGVVASLGGSYGILAPCNSMLVTQIHAMEQMYSNS
ncbi:2-dehydropantoate 2-reductase [Clostridium boliviensis]|uniref:2-dehydropantoate 2-reductase n=1 Tax=Clostridium boliviensis TaxID=318465 RepID=A0ABU4GMV2_9CLOT|nr:2-dehydropantoate 2-reductase [Clostridium boliviensis]MDW2798944.1 2-dehydropantoate 2-reductase [Clostridium boliviensis]